MGRSPNRQRPSCQARRSCLMRATVATSAVLPGSTHERTGMPSRPSLLCPTGASPRTACRPTPRRARRVRRSRNTPWWCRRRSGRRRGAGTRHARSPRTRRRGSRARGRADRPPACPPPAASAWRTPASSRGRRGAVPPWRTAPARAARSIRRGPCGCGWPRRCRAPPTRRGRAGRRGRSCALPALRSAWPWRCRRSRRGRRRRVWSRRGCAAR